MKWRAAVRFRQASLALRAAGFSRLPRSSRPSCGTGTEPLQPSQTRVVCAHFQAPAQEPLRGDWRDCYISWIPKPTKKPLSVSDLRPIGLQCPCSKALSGVLREFLLKTLQTDIAPLPQFAYTKQRGTADALFRVHAHFAEVANLLAQNVVNRFQKQQGKKAARCLGGCSLSLDLSKAFDGVSRPMVYDTLAQHGVPSEVINAIQQLHLSSTYKYTVGTHVGGTQTTNGIKQGCRLAPFLWSYFTAAYLRRIINLRELQWVLQTLTLFADDIWVNWVIKKASDFRKVVQDLELLLTTLEAMHLTVNFRKTAVLLKLVGSDAAGLLKEFTSYQAGQLHLHLTVSGRHCTIPARTHHEYLGTVVSYADRVSRNVRKRQQAGQARQQAIRRVLNGHHILSDRHRISLWRSCVYSSALYSLPCVGCHDKSLAALDSALVRHLRAILRIPAHLSHVTNSMVWQQAQLDRPVVTVTRQLKAHLDRLGHKQACAPDVTTDPKVLDYII